MADLVVFDCDGVLVDSEVLANRAVAELLSGWIPWLDTETFSTRFAGVSDAEIIEVLAEEHGVAFPDDLERQVDDAIDALLLAELRPIAGVAQALDAIAGVKAVASNSPRHRLDASLARAGIAHHFDDRLFSADMVANPKPAPDVYRLAARTLDADPARCLVVEDSVSGVTAARTAGMTVVGFTGASHTWPEHATALRQAGAAVTVAAMDDLPPALAALS